VSLRLLGVLAFSALCLLQSGCKAAWDFDYSSNVPYVSEREEPLALDVVVLPFEDARGEESSYASAYLALFPLWPVGFSEFDRPELAGVGALPWTDSFDFNPTLDLAHATGHAVRGSRIFRRVTLSVDEPKAPGTLRLTGLIRATTLRSTIVTYGLGAFSGVLNLLGLPQAFTEVAFALDLQLESASGEVLWTQSLEDTRELTQGFYTGTSGTSGLALVLREALGEALVQLDAEATRLLKATARGDGAAFAEESNSLRAKRRERLRAFFDANDDGAQSDAETRALRRFIRRHDLDGDGELDAFELERAPRIESRRSGVRNRRVS
jgi:hypothetical protein